MVGCAALAAVAALITMLAPGGRADAASAPTGTPNVVFVQTDDQTLCSVIDAPLCPKGADQVMKKVEILLQRQGTTFMNYFATHPRCCPSRASYLTGKYSHNHGILSNKHGYGRFRFHDIALPVWLKNAGYSTAHVGKYLNGYFGRFADALPVPPGWDEWYATVDDGTYHMFNYSMMIKGPAGVFDLAGRPLAPPTETPVRVRFGKADGDYQTDVEASIAVNYIERQATQPNPFFLAVNPLAPHHEHIGFRKPRNPRPAPRDNGAFGGRRVPEGKAFNENDVSDKPPFIKRKNPLSGTKEKFIEMRYRSRLESLLAVDDMVERIYNALAATNQLDNTVIIFASDNGFMQGEHRLKAGKTALYEESVRVPLIVRGPGFPAGAERVQATGNIDLAPTISDLANATPLLVQDGISLLDFAANPALDPGRAIVLENGTDGSVGVRTKDFAYIEHKDGKELYDMKRDPFQLESMDADKGASNILRDMRARLKALRNCAGPTCVG
jgi:N-acetylglucosamine-6-sulfatase